MQSGGGVASRFSHQMTLIRKLVVIYPPETIFFCNYDQLIKSYFTTLGGKKQPARQTKNFDHFPKIQQSKHLLKSVLSRSLRRSCSVARSSPELTVSPLASTSPVLGL